MGIALLFYFNMSITINNYFVISFRTAELLVVQQSCYRRLRATDGTARIPVTEANITEWAIRPIKQQQLFAEDSFVP
jgi:hypothetical protein